MFRFIAKYVIGKLLPYLSIFYYLANCKKKNAVMYPNLFLVKRIFIDPNKINFFTSLSIKPKKGSTYFLPGDWDKHLPQIDCEIFNNYKFKTAYEILSHNIPLSKTSEYKHIHGIIRENGRYRGYSNALDYMKNIESLYDSIKNNGYLMRKSILNPWVGEVEVGIGRDGELIKINSGNHRFICSRVLNLKKIPVNVCVVHSDYYSEFKKSGFSAIKRLLYDIESKYR